MYRGMIEYIGQRILSMDLPGKRKKGRSQRRFEDELKEKIQMVSVTEQEAVIG